MPCCWVHDLRSWRQDSWNPSIRVLFFRSGGCTQLGMKVASGWKGDSIIITIIIVVVVVVPSERRSAVEIQLRWGFNRSKRFLQRDSEGNGMRHNFDFEILQCFIRDAFTWHSVLQRTRTKNARVLIKMNRNYLSCIKPRMNVVDQKARNAANVFINQLFCSFEGWEGDKCGLFGELQVTWWPNYQEASS